MIDLSKLLHYLGHVVLLLVITFLGSALLESRRDHETLAVTTNSVARWASTCMGTLAPRVDSLEQTLEAALSSSPQFKDGS